VLAAAGGVALDQDGAEVVLHPDTARKMRFVAASSHAAAADLLAAVS